VRFTNYVWDLYHASSEGQRAIEFFDRYSDPTTEIDIDELTGWFRLQHPSPDYFASDFVSELWEEVNTWTAAACQSEAVPKTLTLESLEAEFLGVIDDICSESGADYRSLLPWAIAQISWGFASIFPEFCFPYGFVGAFFRLNEIFNAFEIPMPTPPGIRKYRDRCLYYVDLCRTLHDFRIQHQLSPSELNAFLYSFARNFLPPLFTESIPAASRVYIVGATPADSEWSLNDANPSDMSIWQGNRNTRCGDIALIYGTAPYSCIHCIGRAISEGLFDPLDCYMNRIWVSHFEVIPPISFSSLKENTVWGQKGLVKAHMQGVNGVTCSTDEYVELLALVESGGGDIQKLPAVPEIGFEADIDVLDERDVEQHLLEPLLRRLGYSPGDWTRQLPMRMGRGVRYYADYVIDAKARRGHESGDFVWEAKFQIASERQLLDDLYQAKSYALRLDARGLGLVSREGVWIGWRSDGFAREKLMEFSWSQLRDSETVGKLLVLLGKG